MDPEKLIKDNFDNDDYNRNEINSFTALFISRLLNSANPVLKPEKIATLSACHADFRNALELTAVKGAQQKGGTVTRTVARDEAIAFISRQEGLIRSAFGKGSAAYIEFYPQGITEYRVAPVETFNSLLGRFSTSANKYRSKLGDAFCTEIDGLKVQYNAARDDQRSGIAMNQDAETLVRTTRKALTLELTRCVLLTAAACVEDPVAFNSWFNFGLLAVDNPKGSGTAPVLPDSGGNG